MDFPLPWTFRRLGLVAALDFPPPGLRLLSFAEGKPVVSADRTSVVSAGKTSVVSADKTSAVASDKTSVFSQDIPKALWTQGRPLRGRPCVDNEVGTSWETTDVLSAAAADVVSADTADVLPGDTTDVLSACKRKQP